MTLLTVVQDAMVRMNLTKPATAFANADATVQQMVSFAQDIGDEMVERGFWQKLDRVATITGDGVTTFWPIPSDFGQLSPGFKFSSYSRPNLTLVGPVTNETLQQLKALVNAPASTTLTTDLLLANGIDFLLLTTGERLQLSPGSVPGGISFTVWRIIQDHFEFWPALGKGEVVSYAYYSQAWIQPAVVANQLPTRIFRYAADTDTNVLSENVQTSGVIWRWLASKGLDYAEEFRRYEAKLDRLGGQEPQRVVSMSRKNTIDDTWFPGVITDLTQALP